VWAIMPLLMSLATLLLSLLSLFVGLPLALPYRPFLRLPFLPGFAGVWRETGHWSGIFARLESPDVTARRRGARPHALIGNGHRTVHDGHNNVMRFVRGCHQSQHFNKLFSLSTMSASGKAGSSTPLGRFLQTTGTVLNESRKLALVHRF